MTDEATEILGVKEASSPYQCGSDKKMPSSGPAPKLTQVGSDKGTPSSGAAPKLDHSDSAGQKPKFHPTLKLKSQGSDGKGPKKKSAPKLEQRDSARGKPRTDVASVALRAWTSAEGEKVGSDIEKEAFLGAIRAAGRAFKATKGMGLGSRLRTAGGTARAYMSPAAKQQRLLASKGVAGAQARSAQRAKTAPSPMQAAAQKAGKTPPAGTVNPAAKTTSKGTAKPSLLDKGKKLWGGMSDREKLLATGAGGIAAGSALS
jgi:hypothetical protein